MVTSDLIEDIDKVKMPATRKLFYLWMISKFGFKRYVYYRELDEYPKSRRTIYRYIADLVEAGMVKRIRSGNANKIKIL